MRDDRHATTDDPARRSTAEAPASGAAPSIGTSMGRFVDGIRDALTETLDGEADGRERVGRFEVLGELGRGTFGVVLLALDPSLRCKRAVKVPTARTRDVPSARAKFLDDARLAASIDHPNVVRVLEADEFGDLCYFVMEFCAEGSLSAWMKARPADRPIDPRWAARLVAEIADGVQAAHARKILHRDLKPANVLLVRVGEDDGADPPALRPKVADFGLAKSLEPPEAIEASIDGVPKGTLPYMSPEQARGDGKAISEASDVYGLGAILFELLAGRRAYPGDDRAEILAAILSDAPAPTPTSVRSDLPRELEIICAAAMAKEPLDRYPAAAMLAEDLRRFDRGDPVRGTPGWRRALSWVRCHKVALTVAGVAAAAAVIVAASLAWTAWTARVGAAELWLEKVATANIESLPRLVREQDPSDARLHGPLARMFEWGDAPRKLASSVVLAPLRPDYAEYAYARLVGSDPSSLRPLADALGHGMPTLAARLRAEAASMPPAGTAPDAAESLDRRRSNAAASLFLMGEPTAALVLLRFAEDPQARSFLIHALGPAGAAPGDLIKPIREVAPDVRYALVLALGEVPEGAWRSDPGAAAALDPMLEALYRDDPDPGVHGAAKWLLLRRGRAEWCGGVDLALRGKRREGFGWRISATGLTLVTVRPPAPSPPFEVSDCEITVGQFLRLFPGHPRHEPSSPALDSPMNGLDYSQSAVFCNRLSGEEGLDDADFAYRLQPNGRSTIAYAIDGSSGFRLPTELEYVALGAAGTVTPRYFGASTALLKHYALGGGVTDPRLVVARLKPNDLGLFDTLGNIAEWTRATGPKRSGKNEAVLSGGYYLDAVPMLTGDHRVGPQSTQMLDNGVIFCGFRVVRTLPDQGGAGR